MNVRDKSIRERGIAYPLCALLLSSVMAIVALAVDGARAYAAHEEAQHYARLAALSALESFFSNHKLRPIP